MEYLKNAADSAKARAETAMAGKKLLDEGGPQMEIYLQAKAAARNAVQADAVALAQAADMLAQYETVVTQLESALTSDLSDDQKAEIGTLLETFKMRLEGSKGLVDSTGPPPPLPNISPAEADAIKMLYVKGKVEDAKARSQEVANKAMEKLQQSKPAS